MANNIILHYGTPRHSGRYPWGSGDSPEQRNKSFLGYVDDLRKKGISEVEIAKGMGMTTSQLRNKKSIAKAEQRKADLAEALRLKDKGYSNVAIGERMGINESSVRALLDPALKERSEITDTIANMLKENVEKKGYIDVGIGVERHIGIPRNKLKTSIAMLEEEGYLVTYTQVEQLGTGKNTTVMVLSKPKTKEATEVIKLFNKKMSESDISKELGISEDDVKSLIKDSFSDVYKNKNNVKLITDYSEDGGRSVLGLEPIRSVDSKRVMIRYADDGGVDKDGVVELRRGVDDISLGNAKYAQVRIGVDDRHYMKGMAIYADNMPDGVDMIYNTNKKLGTDKSKVFKTMAADMTDPKVKSILELNISKDEKDDLIKKGVSDGSIKPDPDNPFGASVRQKHYIDSNGDKKLSSLNIVNEEGDWGKWSKTLSSQMLSKQTPALAKKQLGLAFDIKKEEFDEIMSLTNPAVKKRLLDSFADDCDSSSVHLKAAALPRQAAHVLLPIVDIKKNEVYAPNYRNGETVVLIRYPHGGIFEIPQLTVNNKNKTGNNLFKNAKDAIGIHPKTFQTLSGADADGDTVLVIPNPKGEIKVSSPLKGLANFDPKISYPAYEGMTKISPRTKQMKMGDVSNLITDMTIKGANDDEIAAAVRHSMVVIDSEKHNLNYKQSYIDNGIAELKKRYQGSERSGSSTLISKASSDERVGVRKETIDPKTGKKIYTYTNETYIDAKGKEQPRTISSTKMAEAQDAFELSSGTPMETVYAQHANKLKSLANEARKASITTQYVPYSPSAKQVYESEVNSLKASLNIALKNAPLERQAQIIGNTIVSMKKSANPNMTKEDLKKIRGQAMAEARTRVDAKKTLVTISDKEWEAIQAGAVSTNILTQILSNTDLDKVKQLATPRTNKGVSDGKQQKAKMMVEAGYTQAEIADALGVSTSTIAKIFERS
ncbi:MAG: hypothetical protein K0S61_146 [Anaerocolumna sp.]|jgi:DNA-binding CsgD family transcriptional regulator|nr:hypothetical protein [Anaerocolumna sp.]